MSEHIMVTMAYRASDLAGVPVGTRIATNHNKILELDQIETVTKRKDAGDRYWIEPGTLQPFPRPQAHWFPAVILPPVVDFAAELGLL